MGIIAVWKCDRDGAMFDNKKDAEEHDKMLELAANITSLLETAIPELNEQHSEQIGLLLAEQRETLAKACKGKPELLLRSASTDTATTSEGDNVTSLAANE